MPALLYLLPVPALHLLYPLMPLESLPDDLVILGYLLELPLQALIRSPSLLAVGVERGHLRVKRFTLIFLRGPLSSKQKGSFLRALDLEL